MRQNVKRIHMIAVCGTGMGALARMLKDQGYDITGSDQKIYPPMSHFLLHAGIDIADGFDAKNISYGPDLVVVGNAVSKNNPEIVKMLQMGLAYCSMPQAINRFVAAEKKQLVITGTHGKTTTSAILAWVLHEAGFDPSFIIGGILKNFNSNYRLGQGEHIVIEGDEYDTAFFDKGPKFYHYHPSMAVVTGVEFDHADIFRDLQHVRAAFDGFFSRMPPHSLLFAFADDINVIELVRGKSCRMISYGKHDGAQWRLGSVSVDAPWSCFEVFKQGTRFGSFKTKLVGNHNLYNALSVVAMADELEIPKTVVAGALATFSGVKRRQEVRGIKRGITVMDDFAHHPTAVKETIRAVKPFYPSGRIIAVFEPRTNSSMRQIFQNEYALAFDAADLVCIRHPSRLDKIPPAERFSSQKLVEDLVRRGKDAHYFVDTEAIIDYLVDGARHGDLVLIMSNGGFDNIHERLLASL